MCMRDVTLMREAYADKMSEDEKPVIRFKLMSRNKMGEIATLYSDEKFKKNKWLVAQDRGKNVIHGSRLSIIGEYDLNERYLPGFHVFKNKEDAQRFRRRH